MTEIITIEYAFTFEDKSVKNVTIDLNKKSLRLISETPPKPPEWTKLENQKCKNCTLKESDSPHCPVALNLIPIVNSFSGHLSFQDVDVTVTTIERTYQTKTTLQTGLSALIGIIMVTCGCPVMERLKPMVRFHLPFATVQETFFRMFSMYLMSQYIRQKKGGEPKWEYEELTDIYNEVGILNRTFAKRISGAARTDAHMNALVNLDCFATIIPLSIDNYLKDIEDDFTAFL